MARLEGVVERMGNVAAQAQATQAQFQQLVMMDRVVSIDIERQMMDNGREMMRMLQDVRKEQAEMAAKLHEKQD